MFDELYAIAYFNEDGSFACYVRKGRNNAVSAYDNLAAAKRGLAQSRAGLSDAQKSRYQIVTADKVVIVEEDE